MPTNHTKVLRWLHKNKNPFYICITKISVHINIFSLHLPFFHIKDLQGVPEKTPVKEKLIRKGLKKTCWFFGLLSSFGTKKIFENFYLENFSTLIFMDRFS